MPQLPQPEGEDAVATRRQAQQRMGELFDEAFGEQPSISSQRYRQVVDWLVQEYEQLPPGSESVSR